MSSPLTSADTLADHLIAEIASLDGKPYEEIGVPTFFITEDLTAAPPVRTVDDALGARFARLARALATRSPALQSTDIGNLMEVFADREFPGFDAVTPHRRLFEPDAHPAPSDLSLPPTAPPVLTEIAEGMAGSRAIRAVNFHATPLYHAAEFRRQIAAYARAFEPVTPANFAAAIAGDWPYARPGLIPMLFEGFRDNLDVMLPILEEYGFVGWFFVPSIFLGLSPHEQRPFAAAHDLDPALQDEYPGERIALTWEEAREIRRRGHVFACHTRTHSAVTADTPLAMLEDEIVVAKAEMEAALGGEVDIFCWLGGTAIGEHPEADRLLRESGFRYLFSNFKIQRLQ